VKYKDKPLDFAETLKSSDLGTYRFRIGDYRVIFDIEGNDVVVLRVGHRREIYKKK
jgi:mRNA interferase RelE/StbE